MKHVGVFAAGFLLMTVPMAMAQETTGGLHGSVTTEVGTPIAGAVVEASGPLGAVTSTSNAEGRYRFPRLVPGTYTIGASFEGFLPVEADQVRVILGEAVTVDMTLPQGSFEDEITVYSDTVSIDFTESATATNIRQWEIDSLPRGRDFTDVVAFAAGAVFDNQGGGIMIDGASGLENRYVIDGADTTSLLLGRSAVPMRAEFMEEVQVKSAGYMAEYGGAVGGVINAVTRSGGNEFRGGVLVEVERSEWNGGARSELEYSPCNRCEFDDGRSESVTYDKDDEVRYDPGFFLGGPILRDRLWFFASYMPGFRTTERTVDWVSYPPDTYRQEYRVDYVTANLTANIGSALLLKAGLNVSPYTVEGYLPNRNGRMGVPDQDAWAPLGTEGERETAYLNLDWILADNFVISGRAGLYHFNEFDTGIPFFDIIHNYSVWSDPAYLDNHPEIPPEARQPLGWFSDNLQTDVWARNIAERTAASVDASWFVTAAGDHALKAGLQTEENHHDGQWGYNADRILYYWDLSYTTTEAESVTGTYGYFRLLNISLLGEVSVRNQAIFLQDAWSVLPNLTLNLGLRAESEEVPNYGPTGPDPAIEFDWGDKLAPRLGFSWDATGNARWKVYGSYGKYYDVTKFWMPAFDFGGRRWVDFFYTFDTPDPFLNEADTCRTGSNTIFERPECPAGTLIEIVDHGVNVADPAVWDLLGYPGIEPDIKPMESWEAQLGFDHQLTPTIQLGARLVHKELVRTIEDVGVFISGVGWAWPPCNPGEGIAAMQGDYPVPSPVRDYDALELSFDRRFAGNWSLRAYYTLGRLWGNYSGLVSSDEQNGFSDPLDPVFGGPRLAPNIGRAFDSVATMYDSSGEPVYGRLATDRTQQLRAQFLYSFDFGLSLGVTQYIGSGVPISTIGLIRDGHFYPYGRGDLGDTPWLTQTDLSLWQRFDLGRLDFSIGLTVLNLFDEETVLRRWTHRQLQALPLTDEEFFAGFDYEALVETVDQDTAYNLPDSYQQPRRIRLTLKLEF
jgi:hypothetical protein